MLRSLWQSSGPGSFFYVPRLCCWLVGNDWSIHHSLNWQPKISRLNCPSCIFGEVGPRNESQKPDSLSSFQNLQGKFHCVTHYSVEEDWPGHHLMTWKVMCGSLRGKKKQSVVLGEHFFHIPDVLSSKTEAFYWHSWHLSTQLSLPFSQVQGAATWICSFLYISERHTPTSQKSTVFHG